MIHRIRGTYDVLGDDAQAHGTLAEAARRILEPAGYARIETPAFEATELFARGVGEATDIVQKEMYTLPEEGITLRPEGTAPVCRAYLEHGMHKLAQPVKLWYLSSFFRRERPQKGRYRQFWQVGAEAIGSDDPAVDAESILLLAELLEAIGARALRLRLGSLGTPATRAEYRGELQAYLRAHADELSEEVRGRIELNPLRAFDADHPGTRRVMSGAPLLMDRLAPDDREHFQTVRSLLDEAGIAYDVDPTLVRGIDYYTRTLFEFTSDALGAQSGVAGGGRYDGLMEAIGGPPTPGMGWAAGIERMLLASATPPAAPPPVDLYVAYAKPGLRAAAFRLAADARRAGHPTRLELGGRSLKGQLKQADRRGRPLRCHPRRRGHVAQGHGDRRAAAPWRAIRSCTSSGARCEAAAARTPTATRGPASSTAARVGERVRVAGWVHRRRDHGGPDLHRPARPQRPAAARLPSRGRAGRPRARPARALRARAERRGGARAARARQREPEPGDRRGRAVGQPGGAAGRVRDAAVRDRRGRTASTRRCACATACSTCAATGCATR